MTSLTPRLDKLSARNNLIINGNFDFWQRGSSFPTIADETYHTDRFSFDKSGTTAVHTVSRDTDVPSIVQSGFHSTYSLKLVVTTADAAQDAGDRTDIFYRMEGYDYAVARAAGGFRMSFWVKSSTVGTYGLSFRNSASDMSYVTTYTINVADTWEKKTIDILTTNAGTWDAIDGTGVRIEWALMMGSTAQTSTLNEWQSGNFRAPTTQTNLNATISNYWQIAQVSVVPGIYDSSAEIPFNRAGKTIQEELAMCQRYYEKSYLIDTAPGTNTSTSICQAGYAVAAATAFVLRTFVGFSVAKRVAPLVTAYRGVGTVDQVDFANNAATLVSTPTPTLNSGSTGFRLEATTTTTTASLIRFHWTAEAELL